MNATSRSFPFKFPSDTSKSLLSLTPCPIQHQFQSRLLHPKGRCTTCSKGGKLTTTVTALLAAFTGFYTSYAGSKAPVEHFTRRLAKELMPKRISANAVAPGPMDTRELSIFGPHFKSSPISVLRIVSMHVIEF